ncbi:MAG: chorismate mutase [Anaerovoracaceae bacterium]|nr:chorismate mutase [Anaerovoracaceae bacterium]
MSDLNELRSEIDVIDREIIDLFRRRMRVALDIAEYKRENSVPVTDSGRESDILKKVAELAGEELAPYAEELYRSMFEVSKAYQRKSIGR